MFVLVHQLPSEAGVDISWQIDGLVPPFTRRLLPLQSMEAHPPNVFCTPNAGDLTSMLSQHYLIDVC
jgi:hypothetical protein